MNTKTITETPEPNSSALLVSEKFILRYPQDAARKLESIGTENFLDFLLTLPEASRLNVWKQFNNSTRLAVLHKLNDNDARSLILALDFSACVQLFTLMDTNEKQRYLPLLSEKYSEEIRELLDYPANSAGRIMDKRILVFDQSSEVLSVLAQIKSNRNAYHRRIYVADSNNCLVGQIEIETLFFSATETKLSNLLSPVKTSVSPLDPVEEVAEQLSRFKIDVLPVVDINGHLLGVIRDAGAVEALQGDIAGDLQSMVGASREERALSSGWFAVKKRQGWLQINLLTGFLAAAVVSIFEGTISEFTALAILMPIAAGQSGNTGAQALAVTMRGITLREITLRHWFAVMSKEAGAGFINGIAIAVTCSIGVWLWSGSSGLALVIALAMVISMTIAGVSGALVPIVLKRLGQDPAQSSSIVLTTITDIAGFMSFLGIATLLSGLLVQ